VPPSRVACLQQPTGGKDTPLGNALKLGLLLEVDTLVVLRLDRPRQDRAGSRPRSSTPRPRSAREGGIQLGRSPEERTTSASWPDSSSPARAASESWWWTAPRARLRSLPRPGAIHGGARADAVPAAPGTRADLEDPHRHRPDRARGGQPGPGHRFPGQGERLGVEVQPGLCQRCGAASRSDRHRRAVPERRAEPADAGLRGLGRGGRRGPAGSTGQWWRRGPASRSGCPGRSTWPGASRQHIRPSHRCWPHREPSERRAPPASGAEVSLTKRVAGHGHPKRMRGLQPAHAPTP
jgi:hypothetical protein